MFKVNNKGTSRSGVFIVGLGHISLPFSSVSIVALGRGWGAGMVDAIWTLLFRGVRGSQGTLASKPLCLTFCKRNIPLVLQNLKIAIKKSQFLLVEKLLVKLTCLENFFRNARKIQIKQLLML